jgi:hypothetical protein
MMSHTSTQPAFRFGILAAQLQPTVTAERRQPNLVPGGEVVEVADLLGIDFSMAPFTVEDLQLGLEVEREIEDECAPSIVDLVDHDLLDLGKIVVANLQERSDYYTRLTEACAPGDPPMPIHHHHQHARVGAD